MPLPTLICAGVAKAATTSFYEYAGQHPDVFMSPVKETNYFVLYGTRPAFRGPGDDLMFNRTSIWSREDYEAQFEGRSEPVLGEASPRYMSYPEVPARIARDIPECRIVIGLRQPVDRAFAAWVWARRNGQESLPFEEAIEQGRLREDAGWAWGNYLERSAYAAQLRRYFEVFPRGQVHIYLYDDFRADPAAVMSGVFSFIGVDPSFVPDMSRTHNKSGVIRNPALRRLWERSFRARLRTQKALPRRVRQWGLRALERASDRPVLDPQLRRALTDRFEADIRETQELVGRDLSHWLKQHP